jgi:hypothetical protein
MSAMRYLNFIGLLLGLIGVLFIFVWGPPQPSFQDYVPIAVEPATPLPSGKTAADIAAKARADRRLYTAMSRIGLGFIMAGFVLQAVANWPRTANVAATPSGGTTAAVSPAPTQGGASAAFRDQHLIETYKSLVPIAVGALRAVMLLNGGAAVALLAFLGSVVRGGPSAPHLDMRWPMGLFVVGVALAGVAHVTSYITQLALYNESLLGSVPPWRLHFPWLWGSIIAVALSMAAFIWGAMSAVMRFTM